jgi:Chaperone of endosialidase
MSYLGSNPYLLNLVPIFNVANSPTGALTAESVAASLASLAATVDTGTNTLSINTIQPATGGTISMVGDIDIVGALNVNGYALGANTDGVTRLIGDSIFISSSSGTISSILVEGQSYFQNAMYVSSSVSATAFTTVSDERLKSGVQPLTGALSTLCQLEGVRYTMGGQQEIGFLAQQVAGVVPEAVRPTGDGYLGVDYSKIVPLLVESIKELVQRIP